MVGCGAARYGLAMKRRRRIASGQGWLALPEGLGQRLLATITAHQPETILIGEGSIRVHRLPHVEAWGDRKRTNVSGKLAVKPIGVARTIRR